jgi:hypothetical protein
MKAKLYNAFEGWYVYNNTVSWQQTQRNVLERERGKEVKNDGISHDISIFCDCFIGFKPVLCKVRSKPFCTVELWWWSSMREELVTSFFSSLSFKWKALHVGAPVNIDTKDIGPVYAVNTVRTALPRRTYHINWWPKGSSTSANLGTINSSLKANFCH